MAPRVLAALLVLGLAGLVAGAAGAANLSPCSDAEPFGGQCGSVAVPLDPGNPQAGTIEIAFEVYPQTDESAPDEGALVMLQGGPGASTTASRALFVPAARGVRERRDIVLVDVRGTGKSGAIDCPDLELRRGAFDAAVRACAAQLGQTARFYTTAAAAADVDAVRADLGLETIDLYGVSYGTQIAQAYALRYPSRLRSLVLDSAYPLAGDGDVFGFDRMVARAMSRVAVTACQLNPVCSPSAGGAEARFRTLVRELGRRPVTATGYLRGSKHRYRLDESLLARALLGGPTMLVELDAAARAWARGDTLPLARLVFEYNLLPPPDKPAEFSDGDFYAVSCADTSFPWNETDGAGARAAAWTAAWAALPADAFAPFSVPGWQRAEPGTLYSACVDWAPGPTEPPGPPGSAYPNVPTLVLAGDLDLATPLEGARAVAERFPDATLVEFDGYGHGLLGDACAGEIVERFVFSLEPGDTGCSSRGGFWVGSTRFPRTVAEARTIARRMPAGRDGTTARDRRAVAAAIDTVVDVITHSAAGRGLRGGTFQVAPGVFDVRFRLRNVRFVRDLAVSGRASLDAGGLLTARVTIRGKGTDPGTLELAALTGGGDYEVRGRIGGRPVALVVSDGCRPANGYCYPRAALSHEAVPQLVRPRPVIRPTGWPAG